MFGIQFYPTPPHLLEKMIGMVDWSKVQFALEPSAGKGDLAQGIRNRMKQEKKLCQLDCVEIDPDLRAVLRERGFHVAANDFLTWDAQTRYDLIAMTPPFKDGDKHLLHALDLMKHGGQIVCLLNASTVLRPESPLRSVLMDRLKNTKRRLKRCQARFSAQSEALTLKWLWCM